ncbi:MAG: BatA domain-containing protein [candidate division WOR-3 bacterium]|nr:MAG: BatA domain-containing protein [candidate division WOR-3 bacterium]
MGFSAPGLLPLAALAAIPVAIHLLSRLRLRRVDFPSLLLLRTVRRERFSWIRLKEILLLILRTLALLFLFLALARPYLSRVVAGLGRTGDMIVVLDDSYSMNFKDRWARSVSETRDLVRTLGHGQKVMLLTATGRHQVSTPASASRVLAALDSLEPSSRAPALVPVLERASELAESLDMPVLAFTDLQARAFEGDWRPGPGQRISLVDVGTSEFDNCGIAGLSAEDPFPVAGRPVRIEALVSNHGARGVTRTAVLEVDGRQEEQVVRIPGLSSRSLLFETAISTAGDHAVGLELRSDSLETDDRRFLALNIPDRVELLLVESGQVTGRFIGDALRADTMSPYGVTRVDASQMSRTDLRRFDAVIIADAYALTAAHWTRLDFVLRSGAAALIMCGPGPAVQTGLDAYARFDGTVRSAGFVSVVDADTSHPVMAGLGQGLEHVRFWTHSRLDPEGNRVLARLSDRTPLVLENLSHRVIIWSSAPGTGMSDLQFKAVFVPLLHRTIGYLTSTRFRTGYLCADTAFVLLDDMSPVRVSTPDGILRIEPESRNGRPVLAFGYTDSPGIYSVEPGPSFAVNVEPREGDLSRADPDRLRSLGYEVLSRPGRSSSDLTVPLLLAAAAAFAAEMLLLVF